MPPLKTKPMPKPTRHYCVACSLRAVWAKSLTNLCWWCDPQGKAQKKPVAR